MEEQEQQQVQEELIANTHNHASNTYKLGNGKVMDECDKHLQLRLNEFISHVEYFQKQLANEKCERVKSTQHEQIFFCTTSNPKRSEDSKNNLRKLPNMNSLEHRHVHFNDEQGKPLEYIYFFSRSEPVTGKHEHIKQQAHLHNHKHIASSLNHLIERIYHHVHHDTKQDSNMYYIGLDHDYRCNSNSFIGSTDADILGYEKVMDECDKHLQLRLNEFISRVEYFQKQLANEKYERGKSTQNFCTTSNPKRSENDKNNFKKQPHMNSLEHRHVHFNDERGEPLEYIYFFSRSEPVTGKHEQIKQAPHHQPHNHKHIVSSLNHLIERIYHQVHHDTKQDSNKYYIGFDHDYRCNNVLKDTQTLSPTHQIK